MEILSLGKRWHNRMSILVSISVGLSVRFMIFYFFKVLIFSKKTTNGKPYFLIVRFVRVGRAGHCIFQPEFSNVGRSF